MANHLQGVQKIPQPGLSLTQKYLSMDHEKYIIRQSKKRQYYYVTILGIMILWYFVGPYEKTRIIYTKSPTFTILLGILFFVLFSYSLNELIKRKPEITLTNEGIELRDNGFFEWGMIESFSTKYYRHTDDNNKDLILHFKESADLKFDITHLDKDNIEIADLIMTFKGSSAVIFTGHN